jgi:hypothetical protein
MPSSTRKYCSACLLVLLLTVLVGCSVIYHSETNLSEETASLKLVVKNYNTAYNDSNVYFSFRDAPVTGTINGAPIVQGNVYSIANIGSGINLENAGGRIYFSLGSPLPVSNVDPEPVNPNIPGYNVRFDKIELTYNPGNPNSVANLTTIDFFGIPMAIQTYAPSSTTPLQALTFTVPGNTVKTSLAQLAGNSTSVLLTTSGGSFLRVLGPTLSPAGSYPSFTSYINQVRNSGTQFQIKDLFARAGNTPPTTTQCYNFTTSFDGQGNFHMNGGGALVGQNHEIVISANNLQQGIYSANPPYTVDGNSANIGNNDLYAAAVRDVLAAFNYGFMNSSTIDPNTGVPFKQEASVYWWRSPNTFQYLQPTAPNYNQYAAYLYSISSSYGQPFSDRWERVQASLASPTVGTVEIDILPDTGSVPVQPVGVGGIHPPLNCL